MQKLEEAQDISEAVLDAEVKIGELMAKIPKKQGARTDMQLLDSGVQKSKAEIIENAGFSVKQAQRFETLAKNPELVEQAKAEARENDDIVSRSLVLEKVKQKKHLTNRIIIAAVCFIAKELPRRTALCLLLIPCYYILVTCINVLINYNAYPVLTEIIALYALYSVKYLLSLNRNIHDKIPLYLVFAAL